MVPGFYAIPEPGTTILLEEPIIEDNLGQRLFARAW